MIISHTFPFSNSLFLTGSPELYSAYISFSLSIQSNILITFAIISLASSLLNNAKQKHRLIDLFLFCSFKLLLVRPYRKKFTIYFKALQTRDLGN